jgi:hypothetical protein
MEALNELKKVDRRGENKCTYALEKKLILHMKKAGTAPSKVVAMSTKKKGPKMLVRNIVFCVGSLDMMMLTASTTLIIQITNYSKINLKVWWWSMKFPFIL